MRPATPPSYNTYDSLLRLATLEAAVICSVVVAVVAIVVVLAMRFPTLSGFEHVISCHETYTCHRRNNTFG